MPIIYGETGREIRLLPGLSARQALELLGAAALTWACSHLPVGTGLRLAASLAVAIAGTAYAIGRWPPGPQGDRVAAWLPRIAAYVLRPKTLAGTAVPGWDGVRDIRGGWIRHAGGWSAVLECRGGDLALRGAGATEAGQAVYRELVHGLTGSLQVVGLVRHLEVYDRPRLWDPERAPDHLAAAARAYADHWDAWIRLRAVVTRRTLLVVSIPRRSVNPARDLATAAAAVEHCATRLGLAVRRLEGPELVCLLRQEAGAQDARPDTTLGGTPPAVQHHG